MEPLSVDLASLRRSPGLGDLLRYERSARIPLRRRFFVVLAGVLLLMAAIVAALVALAAAGVLAKVPLLAAVGALYGILSAVGFVWFAVGLSRRARLSQERGVVVSEDPRLPFELGVNQSVADGESRATIQRPFAFVELPLPVAVPHIVLRNRRRSIVPTLGLGGVRMELEGDFASTFLLLVPEGYQRDALYIFTPDLMARVLDLGAGAELELVDDRVYVYLPGGTRFDRPDVMRRTLELAEELHRRFAARTGSYRDEAVGATMQAAGLAGGGCGVSASAATASR